MSLPWSQNTLFKGSTTLFYISIHAKSSHTRVQCTHNKRWSNKLHLYPKECNTLPSNTTISTGYFAYRALKINDIGWKSGEHQTDWNNLQLLESQKVYVPRECFKRFMSRSCTKWTTKVPQNSEILWLKYSARAISQTYIIY